MPGRINKYRRTKPLCFWSLSRKRASWPPGNVVATNHDSVCIATIDGAVWIRQFKVKPTNGNKTLKLPASLVLNKFRQPLPTYLPNKDIVNYDLGYLGMKYLLSLKVMLPTYTLISTTELWTRTNAQG